MVATQIISVSGQIAPHLSSRLHTDGRWIEDDNGNNVILNGAAVFWEFMYCSSYSNYNPLAYSTEINESSIELFASTGANFIRLTVNGYLWYVAKEPKYIAAVDMVINWCSANRIMVVLDDHGWYDPDANGGAGATYITNDQLSSTNETLWQDFEIALAQRYTNNPTVIGFDVLNEPSTNIAWSTYYPNLVSVVNAIQAVNSTYLCFVMPLGSATDTGQMNYFATNPLPEPNIVYCAHNYMEWDYPWQSYAVDYANGNFAQAYNEMETLYYERWIFMVDANLPVMNMETGVYSNSTLNPNWNMWENDSLTLYENCGVGVCWYSFDPNRTDSSIFSLLSPDRTTLTSAGEIWALHMNNTY
jgi:hypothetical protein